MKNMPSQQRSFPNHETSPRLVVTSSHLLLGGFFFCLGVLMSIWTPEELHAWAPPEPMSVSQWADRFRVLPPGVTAEPGPWRTSRTPYLRQIMDVMGDHQVEEVVLMKGPQVGGSEAARNAMAYWIDQDPGPCLIIFPSEQSAKEMVDERIIPMLNSCSRLQAHLTGVDRDIRLTQVSLRTMAIYAGHAGSPQSLASRPCRYVVCDEVDKYPPFSGREADPVSLGEARTRTYGHRRKVVQISTPTTKAGLIYQAWELLPEGCRLTFWVTCPTCQVRQPLTFDRLRWDTGATRTAGGPVPEDESSRVTLANQLQGGTKPTWYACRGCEAHWESGQKGELLSTGVWCSSDGKPWVPGPRVGFHISSLYSPWVSWGRVVAEFLRSRSSHGLIMNFMNAWLAEPYEEEMNRLDAQLFEEKAVKGGRRGEVPLWAKYLVASADVGSYDAWYVIRAWGPGYKSRLLDWGRVQSLEELKQRTLHVSFPVHDNLRPAMGVDLLVIDTGGTSLDDSQSRTDQVYKWSLQDRRIACLKGTDKGERPVSPRRITYKPPGSGNPYDVILNLVNVHFYKDVLSARLTQVFQGEDVWEECIGLDEEYAMHMTSEHRILEREGRKVKMVWRPIAKGRPNHLWDCNVYQCAGADMIRVDLLGDHVPVTVEQVRQQAEERAERVALVQMSRAQKKSYLVNRRKV